MTITSSMFGNFYYHKYPVACIERNAQELAGVVWLFENSVTYDCSFHFAAPSHFHQICATLTL